MSVNFLSAALIGTTLQGTCVLQQDIYKVIDDCVLSTSIEFDVNKKKTDLVHYFSKLPASHHVQTLAFLQKKAPYLLASLSSFFFKIKYVKADDLHDFYEYADFVITNQIGTDIMESMADLFHKIPIGMAPSVMECTAQILDDQANSLEKITMIKSFLKMPLTYIQTISKAINQHLKPFQYTSDAHCYVDVLKTFYIDDIDSICEAFQWIQYEKKTAHQCSKLMNTIKEIPIDDRVLAVKEVASVFPHHMTHEDFCFLLPYFYEKIYAHPQKPIMLEAMKTFLGGELQDAFSILGAFLVIPDNEKEARFNRVRKDLEANVIHQSTTSILVNLQLPLGRDNITTATVYTNMDPQSAYTFGMIAESGWRTLRTCNAIQALFKYKTYSEAELDAGYKRFLMYLEMEPLKKREKIKKAIGLIPMEKQAFLPFMEDWARVFNYGVTPQHFIAHLFLFCEAYSLNTYKVRKDQEAEIKNMRQGLFTGFEGCIEDDGTLVCEMGKLQKILTPVLQGRLDNVMIDEIDYDLENGAICGEEKNFIDDNFLKGVTRVEVLHEQLTLEFKKTRVTCEQVRAYINTIRSKLALMRTFPIFKEVITARSVLEKRKKRFFTDHPEIENDPILKKTLIEEVDQFYEMNGGMWGGDKY